MRPIRQTVVPLLIPERSSWALEARLLGWLTLLWVAIGAVVLFSASYPTEELSAIRQQLVAIALGGLGFGIALQWPLCRWLRLAPWAVLLLLLLLFVLLLPGLGREVGGASRWLGPLQPSEAIKPFLVLQGACLFGRWQRLRAGVRMGWLAVFVGALVAILAQPDLSTAALCGLVLWSLALVAGLPARFLGGAALASAAVALVSLWRNPYQQERMLGFLQPWQQPQGDNYQLVQSLLAVGSGGTWGTGLGLSQQKLSYLPIQSTDFIFAVFAEECGLAGTLLLLLLLLSYAGLGLHVAAKARSPVVALVAVGATLFLVGQALINMGVALGVLPTTGLPFPFVSHGSNAMVASLVLAGLLVRAAREGSEAHVVPLARSRRSSGAASLSERGH